MSEQGRENAAIRPLRSSIQVTIWVCPKCGNYYGSSSAGDLSEKINQNAKGDPTFPRSRCPNCKTERISLNLTIDLSELVSVPQS